MEIDSIKETSAKHASMTIFEHFHLDSYAILLMRIMAHYYGRILV
jgi:hypothetical protein